ncbi:aromatic acid/H+ symport family MFS transporter [Azoarcus sp. KH32C]|uniref:MFS transporter n=1 Tax=Azoarcus sp. KH32C TaxID=748247 RepID=UPI00023864E0|nr:aromatic acid/H+ symport family MFS transporter [Azoarcus sp. KH32C]BAL24164.1 major facilitator transporter [Azoarcus sp. KH32C]
MTNYQHPPQQHIPGRVTGLVVLLCWLAIFAEGYDLGVLGAAMPALLEDPQWQLTPLKAGLLGSYTLLGMLIGGLTISTLSELRGRKPMFIVCLCLFSLTMGGAAWAPTPEIFGLFRFIGGLGLGGIIPIAAALTTEYSPAGRKSFNYGLMYSGYSIGILGAALVAMWLLPVGGWRPVMGVGVIPLLIVPLIAWLMPESLEFLVAKGRQAEAQALAKKLGLAVPRKVEATGARPGIWSVLAEIFSPRNAFATACFWVGLFTGLLMVYGLNTWLPQIMRKSGYDLGSSLAFLAVFSLTSAAGGILIGRVADRIGVKVTLVASYLIGAVCIAALTLKGSLLTNYVLVALAGFGSISASLILTSYLANYLAAPVRSAGTGWALSFARIGALSGPLLGGYLADLPMGAQSNFYAFGAAGLLSAVAVFLIPARK